MLRENLTNFQNTMKQPWGELFYKMAWAQLADIINIKDLKILDFGSGLGTTANNFAKENQVIAIEPDADMIAERERGNDYTQIHGKIEKLKDFADGYFDVITCHNVLDFALERVEIVREFSRVLRSNGILSIIKHLKTGRIIGNAVYYNNTGEALSLLRGGDGSNTFGRINYYNPEDLMMWGDNIKIIKRLGLSIFSRLQQNDDIKYEPNWVDKMYELEMEVCDLEPYKNISFFNHILLKKL